MHVSGTNTQAYKKLSYLHSCFESILAGQRLGYGALLCDCPLLHVAATLRMVFSLYNNLGSYIIMNIFYLS